MGAWGHKTFEDDSALDLIDEWIQEARPLEHLEQAISSALAAEYLDFDQGQEVSVASAIVEFALSTDRGPEYEELAEDQDGLDTWLETLSKERLRALVPSVVSALEKLVSPGSELAELWAENEVYGPQWVAHAHARQNRLRALTF